MGLNKPDHFVLIIGAMKSGTTSLFEILGQHPQVCPSKFKEPDFFTKNADDKSRDRYLALWDWHEGIHSFALESSVAYTKAPLITGVPERIYKSKLGQYRFIYMVRDPIARIESHIRHGVFAGWGKSLEYGIPDDAIYFSSYAMQLEEYLRYFSIDNIMLVVLEEFNHSPHAVLTRICRFLDIDKDFSFEQVDTVSNSGDFFNASAAISRITQSNFGQFIASNILPANIKTSLRNAIAHLSKSKKKGSAIGRWQLTTEERERVLKQLDSDLKKLHSVYGIDIGKYWHINSSSP
jgi:hypothetical protein